MNTTLLLALLLAAPAPPGLYYEQVTESTLGKTSRGQAVRTRVYALGRRMRLESADVANGPAMVLRLDEARAFRLDPASKTARPIDLERLREQSQLDLSAAGEALGAAGEGSVRTTSRRAQDPCRPRCRGLDRRPGGQPDLYVHLAGRGHDTRRFPRGRRARLGPVLDDAAPPVSETAPGPRQWPGLTVVTTVTKIELRPWARARSIFLRATGS
jgi:hypothetical protein